MSEPKHVPTTETIKSAHRYYRTGRAFVPDEWSQPDYKIVVTQDEAFDRWLDQIKDDAIVSYLREWADELGPHSLYSKWDIHTMIRNRIQQLREQEEL